MPLRRQSKFEFRSNPTSTRERRYITKDICRRVRTSKIPSGIQYNKLVTLQEPEGLLKYYKERLAEEITKKAST